MNYLKIQLNNQKQILFGLSQNTIDFGTETPLTPIRHQLSHTDFNSQVHDRLQQIQINQRQIAASNSNHIQNSNNKENWQESDKLNQNQQQHSMQNLQKQIELCNFSLRNYGYNELSSSLNSLMPNEAQCLLITIEQLLQQRQKDTAFRNEQINVTAKLISQKESLVSQKTKLSQRVEQLEKENGALQNATRKSKMAHQEREGRCLKEKEEMQLQMQKAHKKCVQLEHELKKREADVSKITEQLRRVIEDKTPSQFRKQNSVNVNVNHTNHSIQSQSNGNNASNSSCSTLNNAGQYNYINSFSVIQCLSPSQNGNIKDASGDTFKDTMKMSHDRTRAQIMAENQDLRACTSELSSKVEACVKEAISVFIQNQLSAFSSSNNINNKTPSSVNQTTEMAQSLAQRKQQLHCMFSDIDMIPIRQQFWQSLPFAIGGPQVMPLMHTNLRMLHTLIHKLLAMRSNTPQQINNCSNISTIANVKSNQQQTQDQKSSNNNNAKSANTKEEILIQKQIQQQSFLIDNPSQLIDITAITEEKKSVKNSKVNNISTDNANKVNQMHLEDFFDCLEEQQSVIRHEEGDDNLLLNGNFNETK